MNRILLVEDDPTIALGLKYALEQADYAVTHSKTVSEANAAITTATNTTANTHASTFDLAILDMQLPDGTGFDVREKLKNTNTAIIFLTIIDDEGNIVRAFDGGADDYITKPFRLRELLARIKRTLSTRSGAVSGGGGSDARSSLLTLGGATIDTATGKVFAHDTPIELTALEYRLLITFASNRGLMLTRTQILESIWDSTGNFVEDNTLTVYVKRLREKLGSAVNIETVRGIGYRAD